MRILFFLLLAQVALADVITSVAGNVETTAAPTGSPLTSVDTFTRANSDNLNDVDCDASDTCEWTEIGGDVDIASNSTRNAVAETWRIVNNSETGADTLSQYVAAQYVEGAILFNFSGPTLRDEGLSTGGNFYTLRFAAEGGYEIRACSGSASCQTITLISAADLGGVMGLNDSIGLTTDTGTGDSVVFTAYRWENAVAPIRANWSSTATAEWSVCASGCDQGFNSNAPTATSHGASDTGIRGGIYNGAVQAGLQWDNWMFGDNP